MALLLPRVADALTARALDLIRNAFAELETRVFPTGKVVKGVQFTAGNAAVIAHGLGRVWTGYVVVRSSAAQTLYDGLPTANPSQTLRVVPSATGSADVYVF